MDSQLRVAQDSLARSNAYVESMESSKALMDIDNQSKSATNNLEELKKERVTAELRLMSYRNVLDYISRDQGVNLGAAPSNFNINDPTINRLLGDLADLNLLKSSRSVSETENSPNMIRLNNEIQTTRKALRDYLMQNVAASQASLQVINQRIGDFENLRTQLPIENSQLDKLKREFEFNQNKYENLLDKRNDARLGLATNTSDFRVVEAAKQEGDKPIKPNTKFIYLISLVLGFGLPLAYIVAEDLMNSRIKSREDIKESTDVPLLAMIAEGPRKVKNPVLDSPKSLVNESLRSLWISLESLWNGNYLNQARVVGITSTVDGEGKTYCAVNLGILYAQAGKRTLLIGADLYKTQFTHHLDVKGYGLSDYLIGKASMHDIIHNTEVEDLHVIPTGTVPENPQGLLVRPALSSLITELKSQYDYIILDIPPLGLVSDYFVLKNHLDKSLYIIRYNYTGKKLLNEINELYEAEKVDNIYLVFNAVKFASMYEFQFKSGKTVYYQA
ncbi:MAG: polysaccharide biosynthesis tyrosine autokinase [Bacteroidia bacterium]|nr:polysaccharide biosynthesis tyrosine autokinase [Bacteroidia bacterium]